MGICASSSKIQESDDGTEHENSLYPHVNVVAIGLQQVLGSVHSKPGSKGANQDSAILHHGYGTEERTFFGVFDGHGENGHIASAIVRNRLPTLLLNQNKALTAINSGHKWEEACMINAFTAMDKEIKLHDSFDFSSSGTTAVIAIRQGDDLVIANLGDSRALLGSTDENGITGVPLTIDLKPSLPMEAARIKQCNGRILALQKEPHIQRVWLPNVDMPGLAMSRSFGDFHLKKHGIIAVPEISFRRLSANDQFIVLACDGVWDVLSNDEVASIVWASNSEEEAAEAVVDAANVSWAEKYPSSKVDDCTVVCLFLKNTPNVAAS